MSPSRSLRHSVARNGARKPVRRPWPAGIAGKRPRLRLVRYPRTTWAPEAGNGLRKRFLLLPHAGLKAMGPSDFRRGGLAVTVIPSSAFPGAKDRGGKCGGVCVPAPRVCSDALRGEQGMRAQVQGTCRQPPPAHAPGSVLGRTRS